MGFLVALVLVGAVVILGGGNSLKGLGTDLKNTGSALETKVNGREPSGNTPTATPQNLPQLPKQHTYVTPVGAQTIPAAE